MTPRDDYVPIDCTFHDRLEHWAVLRKPVAIVYVEAGQPRQVEAVITDVFAADGADHAWLDPTDNGPRIRLRLDRIISVDGVPL